MIDLAKIDYDHMLEEAQPQIIDIAYRLTEKVLGERLTDSEVYWFKMLKQVGQSKKVLVDCSHRNCRIC